MSTPSFPRGESASANSHQQQPVGNNNGKSSPVGSPSSMGEHATLGSFPRREGATTGQAVESANADAEPSTPVESPVRHAASLSSRKVNEIYSGLLNRVINPDDPVEHDVRELRSIADSLDRPQIDKIIRSAFLKHNNNVVVEKSRWIGAIANALTKEHALTVADKIDAIRFHYSYPANAKNFDFSAHIEIEEKQMRSQFLGICLNSMNGVNEEIIDIFVAKAFTEGYDLTTVLVGKPGTKLGGLRDAFPNFPTEQCDRICSDILKKARTDPIDVQLIRQMQLSLPYLSGDMRENVLTTAQDLYSKLLKEDKRYASMMRDMLEPYSDYAHNVSFQHLSDDERRKWKDWFDGTKSPRAS